MFRSWDHHQGAALLLAKITLLKNTHWLISNQLLLKTLIDFQSIIIVIIIENTRFISNQLLLLLLLLKTLIDFQSIIIVVIIENTQ